MGYLFSASQVLKKNIDASWESPNLSNVSIDTIFSTYRKVYLTLTHTTVPGTFYVDLFSVLDTLKMESTAQTINAWLLWLGNRTIPSSSQPPNIDESTVKYNDAWRANYSIKPVSSNASPDAPLPRPDQKDLLLTKTGVDYVDQWEYLLAIVNGFVHRVGGSSHGFYVIGGGETGYIGNDNRVGLLSFKDVGKIKCHRITHEMLHKHRPDQQYGDYVYLKTPYSVANKTVLMVIGGYLHILDHAYKQLSDSLIRINTSKLNLAERIYASRGQINLDSLQLETAPHKPEQLGVEELFSDETVVGYLTLPQSFLVILDRSNFFVRKNYLETLGTPGRYAGPVTPTLLPVVGHLGKLMNYFPVNDDGRRIYADTENQDPNYLFQTRPWHESNSIDDKRYPAQPWTFASGYQLEFGTFG